MNLLEDIVAGLAKKIICPAVRYFTYSFIIVGISWLGGANYYYFIEECTKFKATLITGFIFFALALITILWEHYINKKNTTKNNLNRIALEALPIAMPILFNLFRKTTLKSPALKILAIVGAIGTILYYIIRNKSDKN